MEANRLIDMLLEHPGQYISGEEISRRLSISRTAVWKQIAKLREEGYEFESAPRRGYRLVRKPDKITHSALVRALQDRVLFGRQIRLLEKTVSTQAEVRELAEAGAPSGTLVVAEEQTGGRGRQGRAWYSPPGKGVWMSLLLRPDRQPLSFAPQLTLLIAVAVCRAVRHTAGVDAGIKWPNDLLVGGRKICGILVESVGEDELIRYAVAGIGIDVNLEAKDIPPQLQDVATSLHIESGRRIDRAELIGAVLAEIEQLYELYRQEGFAPIGHLWEALSVTLGRRVTVKTPAGDVTGLAKALDPSGALVLAGDNGNMRIIFSGEVQFGG
ncbi:biotin--[acetyl-CoA-carboxylase] ligase [Paenibacillus oralis]|uniref:Bifunctional ligase/repressor BirA n=1 Tax=Paenibacillus oralis TaxID=2490856 RepID=A0A3P3U7F2_9BACL|nr:biotin--[acetyl-CoA-carboxylase] ligase [Paenibacillus oralis]RRJ66297.1 biotin--[acetyl-CoA-carboxylase] ligase [Paenibacillus oralis]